MRKDAYSKTSSGLRDESEHELNAPVGHTVLSQLVQRLVLTHSSCRVSCARSSRLAAAGQQDRRHIPLRVPQRGGEVVPRIRQRGAVPWGGIDLI